MAGRNIGIKNCFSVVLSLPFCLVPFNIYLTRLSKQEFLGVPVRNSGEVLFLFSPAFKRLDEQAGLV